MIDTLKQRKYWFWLINHAYHYLKILCDRALDLTIEVIVSVFHHLKRWVLRPTNMLYWSNLVPVRHCNCHLLYQWLGPGVWRFCSILHGSFSPWTKIRKREKSIKRYHSSAIVEWTSRILPAKWSGQCCDGRRSRSRRPSKSIKSSASLIRVWHMYRTTWRDFQSHSLWTPVF